MDTGKLEALERLMRLRDAGALSEAEFQAEKAKLLQVPASTAPPEPDIDPLETGSSADRGNGQRAPTPVWARKKRSVGTAQVVALLCAILVATVGATMWLLYRDGEPAYSFVATGPANVRDAPTAEGSDVVGRLAEGDVIVGRVRATGETEWVEVVDGPLSGRFVWAGNLATEGPDEVLGIEASSYELDARTSDPVLHQLMERHRSPGAHWAEVSGIAPQHEGLYSLRCGLGGPEFRGNRVDVWWAGNIEESDVYRKIYRSGDRYIQIVNETYFVRDFGSGRMRSLETISAGRPVPTNSNAPPVPRCGRGSGTRVSAPPADPTPREVLFTAQGITSPDNLDSADCLSVVAARAALSCSAQILGSMPNASYSQRVRTAFATADQHSGGRCRAEFVRFGQTSEVAAQQAIGDVYSAVADAAVYGGDVSEQAINQCIRNVVGRLAGAGL